MKPRDAKPAGKNGSKSGSTQPARRRDSYQLEENTRTEDQELWNSFASQKIDAEFRVFRVRSNQAKIRSPLDLMQAQLLDLGSKEEV